MQNSPRFRKALKNIASLPIKFDLNDIQTLRIEKIETKNIGSTIWTACKASTA